MTEYDAIFTDEEAEQFMEDDRIEVVETKDETPDVDPGLTKVVFRFATPNLKAPQERKTVKKIKNRDLGHPPIKLDATDSTLTVGEILEGSNGPAIFRSREEIELLRDFCEAWLAHDEKEEVEA